MTSTNQIKTYTIAVDFDGTIVTHRYPKIGEPIPGALETLRKLSDDGHRLILWSVREGSLLDEAVEYCRDNGVTFYAINRDYPEELKSDKTFTRKIKADIFIDDRNIGGLPDWDLIYSMISEGRPHVPTYTGVVVDRRQEEMMSKYRDKSRKKGFFDLFK